MNLILKKKESIYINLLNKGKSGAMTLKAIYYLSSVFYNKVIKLQKSLMKRMQSFIKINFTLHVNPKHKTPTLNITKQHWMHFDDLMFIMEKILLTETYLHILSKISNYLWCYDRSKT